MTNAELQARKLANEVAEFCETANTKDPIKTFHEISDLSGKAVAIMGTDFTCPHIDDHGYMGTCELLWDCECLDDYIHVSEESHDCACCGVNEIEDGYPDSRCNEARDMGMCPILEKQKLDEHIEQNCAIPLPNANNEHCHECAALNYCLVKSNQQICGNLH